MAKTIQELEQELQQLEVTRKKIVGEIAEKKKMEAERKAKAEKAKALKIRKEEIEANAKISQIRVDLEAIQDEMPKKQPVKKAPSKNSKKPPSDQKKVEKKDKSVGLLGILNKKIF